MKMPTSNEMVSLAMEAWGKNQDRPVDVSMLAQSLLGIKDAQGRPIMSEHEMKHPAAFLMLNQLAQGLRAMASNQAPQGASASRIGVEKTGGVAPQDREEDVGKLKEEIARLNKVLAQKEREIKKLKGDR